MNSYYQFRWRRPLPLPLLAGAAVFLSASLATWGTTQATELITIACDDSACDAEPSAEACDEISGSCGCDSCSRKGCLDWACDDAHAGLNFDNDFTYLDDPSNQLWCFGDSLKRLCKQGDHWFEVGGTARLRYHDEQNMGRQVGTTLLDEATSNPLLLQIRPYVNWHVNNSVRVFAEGLYADVVDENFGYRPRGNERNRGDFMNLFADFQLTDQTMLRVGRQQLRYGSRRLIAGPGWANTSRNHDGARLIVKGDGYQVEGLYMNTVGVQVDQVDQITDDRRLFGGWATLTSGNNRRELYYIGYDDNRVGRERTLHHIGSRAKGGSDWLYEIEGIAQFGRQAARGLDHLAGMFVAGIGKDMKDLPWSPTLWVYFDMATGDNGGGNVNRYDRIYDRAHHELGLIDTIQRGNVQVLSLQGTLKPTDRLDLMARYYRAYAHRKEDVVTALGGVAPPQRFDSSDYGDVTDFAAKWRCAPRTDMRLGYSYFWPGSKLISQNEASLLYLESNVWF